MARKKRKLAPKLTQAVNMKENLKSFEKPNTFYNKFSQQSSTYCAERCSVGSAP